MAFNISLAAATRTELESYEWFTSAGVSLKNVRTYLFQSTVPSGWVDVSNYVRSIRITGSITNLSGEPGTNDAFIELDNLDKRFTDINTTGPYYGNLNPNQQMKVDLSVGAESVTIFNGRVAQNGFVEERQGEAGIATVNVFDDAYAFMRRKFDKDYFYENKKLVDEDDAGNSLLHILLQNHASLLSADIVTNGAVACTVPYTVFREGDSFQDVLREIATASLAQYAGFRHDGKYVFESRLIGGWSEPTAEYVLTSESYNVNLTKEIVSLIGNNVKVRGTNDFSRDNMILWDLSKIREVGVNSNFPHDCWETVATGDFYLGTPTDPFIVEYTTRAGELLKASSLILSVKVKPALGYPRWNWSLFSSTGTDLDKEATKGEIVLQSSSLFNIYVMAAKVTGRGIIRRNLSGDPKNTTKGFIGTVGAAGSGHIYSPMGWNQYWEGDDLNWGRIGVASNASSISMYGQTDFVVSSEMICGNTQLDNILQWHLLNGKDPKHMFTVNNLPFMAFMQPGAPVWLNLTDLGFSGMVTVQSFEHNIMPDTADTTLSLLENPGDWAVSTGASIREIYAAGSGGTGPEELGAPNWGGNTKYYIGANGCSLPVDVICDGVSDHKVWNDAISIMVSRGGGTIVGIGGKFITSAPISLQSNIAIELTAGTTIEGCGSYNIFEAIGTSATHLSSIVIFGDGLITRDETLPNSTMDMIKFDYVDNCELHNFYMDVGDNCTSTTTTFWSIYFNNDTNCMIDALKIRTMVGIFNGGSLNNVIKNNTIKGVDGYSAVGIMANGAAKIHNNIIHNLSWSGETDGIYYYGYQYGEIFENQIFDCSCLTGTTCVYGIHNAVSRAFYYNNIVRGLGNASTPSNAIGIWNQTGSAQCRFINNTCHDNGNDAGYPNTKGNHFLDNGTSTQVSANSWQL